MALHTKLPIYIVTYDLLRIVTEMIRNMPRDYKVSLGGKLREECTELAILVYRANSAADKTPILTTLLERVQVVELMLRLCTDLKIIATKQYSACTQLTNSIGKQANGWKKYSHGKN